MKLKALIAGLALAAGAGSAQASIGLTTNSELFLSVWDQTAQQSYSQDLGVNLAQFLTNTNVNGFNSDASWSVSLNSVWGQFFNAANASATVWNVAAGNSAGGASLHPSQTYGYLSSFNQANPALPAPNNAAGPSQITATNSVISSKVAIINGADTTVATNSAAIWTSADPAYYGSSWGGDFNQKVPVTQSNQGVYGEVLATIFHGLNIDRDAGNKTVDRWVTLPGTFQLSGNSLSYSVSAVPVPAAVWLFGSALAGLVGFSRRGNRV